MKKSNIPDRARQIADSMRTSAEVERDRVRLATAERQLRAQNFADAIRAGDLKAAFAIMRDGAFADPERASLWRLVPADQRLAFLALRGARALVERVIGERAATQLRIQLTPDEELPKYVWVSGKKRGVRTPKVEISEEDFEILSSYYPERCSSLRIEDRALPARGQLPMLGVRDGRAYAPPGRVAEGSLAQYRRFWDGWVFPSTGVQTTVERDVPVSRGDAYGIEMRSKREIVEGNESVPVLLDQELVDALLHADSYFKAYAIVRPATPAEVRRELSRQASRDGAAGALGG